MCGEQHFQQTYCARPPGSSPRVRGAGVSAHAIARHTGIIPACAGSRYQTDNLHSSTWDHPRVCGEQFVACPTVGGCSGSSPRVRGAVQLVGQRAGHGGIIPACAGSSTGSHIFWLVPRDHPRVCGEQMALRTALVPYQGSSPRVRGAGKQSKSGLTYSGIIPACAGSRAVPRRPARGQRDHPRVCGEQSFAS